MESYKFVDLCAISNLTKYKISPSENKLFANVYVKNFFNKNTYQSSTEQFMCEKLISTKKESWNPLKLMHCEVNEVLMVFTKADIWPTPPNAIGTGPIEKSRGSSEYTGTEIFVKSVV